MEVIATNLDGKEQMFELTNFLKWVQIIIFKKTPAIKRYPALSFFLFGRLYPCN